MAPDGRRTTRDATPSVPNVRPLLIRVILGLLIAAVVVFYAGSRPTRLLESFRPTVNGSILYHGEDGVI